MLSGSILQVSISRGGVPKRAIPQGDIGPLGIAGDSHAHPEIHGGPQQAILLISSEAIAELTALGYPLISGRAWRKYHDHWPRSRAMALRPALAHRSCHRRVHHRARPMQPTQCLRTRNSESNIRRKGRCRRRIFPALGAQRVLRQRHSTRTSPSRRSNFPPRSNGMMALR